MIVGFVSTSPVNSILPELRFLFHIVTLRTVSVTESASVFIEWMPDENVTSSQRKIIHTHQSRINAGNRLMDINTWSHIILTLANKEASSGGCYKNVEIGAQRSESFVYNIAAKPGQEELGLNSPTRKEKSIVRTRTLLLRQELLTQICKYPQSLVMRASPGCVVSLDCWLCVILTKWWRLFFFWEII